MSPESQKKTPVRELPWNTYRKRVCENMQHCQLCGKPITLNETYRSGGHPHTAHEGCVQDLLKSRREADA